MSKSDFEFLKRFSKYLHSTGLSVGDLTKMSSLEVFKAILKNTFVFSLKNKEFEKEGFIKLNQHNQLSFLELIGNDESLILMNKQEIIVQNLNLPILSLINSKPNTNIKEIFIPLLENNLKTIVLNSIFSRYQMYTKKSFYKRLIGVKWSLIDDIRWAIKEVHNDFGIIEKDYILTNGSIKKGLALSKKMIHNSCSSPKESKMNWDLAFPEEKELFIQGGESGIVFSDSGNYMTAFVEVFPKVLKDGEKEFSSFIRGEGETFEEAEIKAFDQLKKAKDCSNHEWDRRNRTDGCGFCKKCNVFNSNAFPELKK